MHKDAPAEHLETAEKLAQELALVYQGLSEKQKFKLSGQFNLMTGGKLSPFNSPEPVVVGIIPVFDNEGHVKFLGIRRAIEPFIGGLALPSGFLDENEEPLDGMIREILEETGIELHPSHFTSMLMPRKAHNNRVLLFLSTNQITSYETFEKARTTVKNDEVSELVLLNADSALCFPLHEEALRSVAADF